MAVLSIKSEIRRKAQKTRDYLNKPGCPHAIWEVQEAAASLWPSLSKITLEKIEHDVGQIDLEQFKSGDHAEIDRVDNEFWAPFPPIL